MRIDEIRSTPGAKLIGSADRVSIIRTPYLIGGSRVPYRYAFSVGGTVVLSLDADETQQLAEVLSRLVEAGEITGEMPKDAYMAAVKMKQADEKPCGLLW